MLTVGALLGVGCAPPPSDEARAVLGFIGAKLRVRQSPGGVMYDCFSCDQGRVKKWVVLDTDAWYAKGVVDMGRNGRFSNVFSVGGPI